MTAVVRRLLQTALELGVDERTELALELLASCEPAEQADVEAAWADEIERRARRALSGESKGTDWEVVRQRIAAELGA